MAQRHDTFTSVGLLCVVWLLLGACIASAASTQRWLVLVNQSRPGRPPWVKMLASVTPHIAASFDTSGTTRFHVTSGDGQPPIAGSVADDFPVPDGQTCSKLFVALDTYQYFSRNFYRNFTNGEDVYKQDNVQNPSKVRFGILRDNATTHLPADEDAVVWLDVAAPVGNWSNMTNFADGRFYSGRADMTQWFELDLTSLNGGAGLLAGCYWLVVNIYINCNYVYTYINMSDPNAGKWGFQNYLSLWLASNDTYAYTPFGGNAVRPDGGTLFFYTQDFARYSPGTWTHNYCNSVTNNRANTSCEIAMLIVGFCTSDGTERNLFTAAVPPPVCTWNGTYGSNTDWGCPFADNTVPAGVPSPLPSASSASLSSSPAIASNVPSHSSPVVTGSTTAPRALGYDLVTLSACMMLHVYSARLFRTIQ